MSRATPSEAEVARTLSDLTLSPKNPSKPKSKPTNLKNSTPIADSWDDGLSSSGSDTETEAPGPETAQLSTTTSTSSGPSPISTIPSYESPAPPPPTPASPTPFEFQYGRPEESRGGRGMGADVPMKRPEKTTAVAGRLIAGALGVKAPKRTEEEREFDRVVREKEKRRREEERERERREREEKEARKRAVWED